MIQLLDTSPRSVPSANPSSGKVSGPKTDGFRFILEIYDPSNPRSGGDCLPRGAETSKFGEPQTWSWPPWEVPQWHAEIKPLFAAMRQTFAGIPEHPTAR